MCSEYAHTCQATRNPTRVDVQFVSTNNYNVPIIHLQLKHMEADYAVKTHLQMWLSHLETPLQIAEGMLYTSGLHCFWTAKSIKEQVLTIVINHTRTKQLLRVLLLTLWRNMQLEKQLSLCIVSTQNFKKVNKMYADCSGNTIPLNNHNA
jgi:hypothetical protein